MLISLHVENKQRKHYKKGAEDCYWRVLLYVDVVEDSAVLTV